MDKYTYFNKPVTIEVQNIGKTGMTIHPIKKTISRSLYNYAWPFDKVNPPQLAT